MESVKNYSVICYLYFALYALVRAQNNAKSFSEVWQQVLLYLFMVSTFIYFLYCVVREMRIELLKYLLLNNDDRTFLRATCGKVTKLQFIE